MSPAGGGSLPLTRQFQKSATSPLTSPAARGYRLTHRPARCRPNPNARRHRWTSRQRQQLQSLSSQSVRTSHNEAFAGAGHSRQQPPAWLYVGLRKWALLRIPDSEVPLEPWQAKHDAIDCGPLSAAPIDGNRDFLFLGVELCRQIRFW